MEVREAIESRRSIRKYRDKPVSQEVIRELIDAARLAPSTSNTQSWKFKVVTDLVVRQELRQAAFNQKFIEQAPVVIACCLDLDAFKEKGKKTLQLVLKGAVRPSMEMVLQAARGGPDEDFDAEQLIIDGTINVAIAIEHIVLTAEELGLGTCWVRFFDPERAAETLELPDSLVLLSLLTVGYPDQSPAQRPRKQLEEILI